MTPTTLWGRPLTDETLATILADRVRMAVGYADSRLSRTRVRTADYYDAMEPKPLHSGNSSYVSQDVYQAVEAMKAQLLETFTGNTKPVQFSPQTAQDQREADVATEYCDYVVFRQNEGLRVFADVIHDGLVDRVGIAQVYWRKQFDAVAETLEGIPLDAWHQIAVTITDKITDAEITDAGNGIVNVSYTRVLNKSQVVIESVPPEEFGIAARAVSLEKAEIVYRRSERSYSDMLKAGYDKADLDEIWHDDTFWSDTDPEKLQRFRETDDAAYLGLSDPVQEARRLITVYDVYTELDMDGTGKSDLYHVVFVGNRVLEKERVSRKPFITFAPLPRPHMFWGDGYAERLIQTQNARTLLTRAVIDHALITTNPRYKVMRGGLVNPKELLENRIGGLVNITRPDAIAPMDQAGLNPFVFQVVQMLGENQESISGISQLSQGLNKDAISKQNSADMMGQMVAMSQQRQKIIARWFGEFMRNLWLAVYQLVIENETAERVIQVSGDWVPVDPSRWAARSDVSVQFAIGYGEQEKEAQKYMAMDQYLANPNNGFVQSGQYTPAQRYQTLGKAFSLGGVKDIQTHLLPPDVAKPPAPNPVQQAIATIPIREQSLKERHQQFLEQKLALDHGQRQAEQGAKQDHLQTQTLLQVDKQGLEHQEFHHQMVMDAAEVGLQRHANTIKADAAPRRVMPPTQ